MSDISVFILTFNEELHIERCINSIKDLTSKIYVIDSFSNDNTVAIARLNGAIILQNAWVDHATQVNWAIKNCPFDTNWIMRLDADEVITTELSSELKTKLSSLNENVTGLNVKRRVFFMGKWIKHGGYYPTWLLRIWRNGSAICEQRIMDEHMKLLHGDVVNLNSDIIDENINNITWWTEKHNNYATKEAFELLNHVYNFNSTTELVQPRFFGSQTQRKRWLKYHYASIPLFVRPFIYFIYRYFCLLGFLDGSRGLIWHFLQGFWYRFLVDVKIFDIYRRAGRDRNKVISCLKDFYGIKI